MFSAHDPESAEAQQFVLDYVKDALMHEVGHALGLRHVDVEALLQRAHRGIAHVVMVEAAKQVVEHAEAQRPVGVGHVLEIEFLEDRGLTRRRADAAAGEPQRSRSVPPAGSFGEIVESGQHLRCPPRTVA